MTQNYVFSSANNTYIPTFSPEASNQLIVSYARDPKRFAVNRYQQVVKVETQVGKYIRLNQYDASRMLSSNGNDIVWADGADRPINSDQAFEYPSYSTFRRSLGFHIGDLSMSQAAWDILAAKAAVNASRMMTYITASAIGALTASGVLPTATATSLGGGLWGSGNNTTAGQDYFRRGVQNVLATIMLATNSVVDPSEIMMIVNPNTARLLSSSVETVDTVKQSPYSLEFLEGGNSFNAFGLPKRLFGLGEVIVESSVSTTSKPKANGTGTQSFTLPDNVAIFVSRPGGIEGQMGSFSTLQGFFKEEMTTESWTDPINRRTVGSVTSDWDHEVASPISGYYVTGVIS